MSEELSNRREIVKQTVSISKSDLPEGWSPEAADFLIRLVVKTPNYRLGKLGSYERTRTAKLSQKAPMAAKLRLVRAYGGFSTLVLRQ